MPSRSYIEAMDQPTILYILYTMVSAQQTNLLAENALGNNTIFAQKGHRIYATTSQYLNSYGCTITMVRIYIHTYIYVYIYIQMLSNHTAVQLRCLGLTGTDIQLPPSQTTTTQCKSFERKWSMCLSWWKEKGHQRELQQVTPHLCWHHIVLT